MTTTKQSTTFSCQLGILLLSLLAACNAIADQAAAPQAIDVVFVIQGSATQSQPGSPQLAMRPVKRFLSLLDTTDRAAIISAGEKKLLTNQLTTTDSDKNLKILFKTADNASAQGTHVRWDDTLRAVQQIMEQNIGTSDRQPHLVILSIDNTQQTNETQAPQFTNQQKENLLFWFKANNITVHTITLNNKHQLLLKEFAETSDGSHAVIDSMDQLEVILTDLFRRIKQRGNLSINGDSFFINQSIKQFYLVNKIPATPISLVSPSGKTITADNKPGADRWIRNKYFETIRVDNPEAGHWKLNGDTDAMTLYIPDTLSIKYQLTPDEIHAGDTLNVVAWLEQDNRTISDNAILQFLKPRLHSYYNGALIQSASLFPMRTQPGKFSAAITVKQSGSINFQISMEDNSFKREVRFKQNVKPRVQEDTGNSPANAPDTLAVTPLIAGSKPSSMQLLEKKFPHLEQALIILTSANGIMIILGLFVYAMKRRLNRFSSGFLTAQARTG